MPLPWPRARPTTLGWVSLTRNGQLLDLKLQVNRGVLIGFGSSSLKTHGPLQTGELLGIYFSYIPRQHLQRNRKEVTVEPSSEAPELRVSVHSIPSGLQGVSQQRILFVPINYLNVLNNAPLIHLPFPQDIKGSCRVAAICNNGNSSLPLILLPW